MREFLKTIKEYRETFLVEMQNGKNDEEEVDPNLQRKKEKLKDLDGKITDETLKDKEEELKNLQQEDAEVNFDKSKDEGKFKKPTITLRMARDKDTNEYIVKYYEDGKYIEDKSYYTADKQDAELTKKEMEKRLGLSK